MPSGLWSPLKFVSFVSAFTPIVTAVASLETASRRVPDHQPRPDGEYIMKRYTRSICFVAFLSFGVSGLTPVLAQSPTNATDGVAVPLAQAISIAEREGQGKVIKAEFDIEGGKPVWEVKVLGPNGVVEFKVDATSSKIIKTEIERIRGSITTLFTGLNLKTLESVQIPVADALNTAERQQAGGRAVKVEVEHERGGIQYDVFVRAGDRTQKIMIDGATGNILSSRAD